MCSREDVPQQTDPFRTMGFPMKKPSSDYGGTPIDGTHT